jgi:hypothetical protein
MADDEVDAAELERTPAGDVLVDEERSGDPEGGDAQPDQGRAGKRDREADARGERGHLGGMRLGQSGCDRPQELAERQRDADGDFTSEGPAVRERAGGGCIPRRAGGEEVSEPEQPEQPENGLDRQQRHPEEAD